MKNFKTVLFILLAITTLVSTRVLADAEEGTPLTSYVKFLDYVESNAIVSAQYSPANHTLVSRTVNGTATNSIACLVPWFGGQIDPLLDRLLVAHHITVTADAPVDDRWQVIATSAGVLLAPILILGLLIFIFIRQTKIMKKLDVS